MALILNLRITTIDNFVVFYTIIMAYFHNYLFNSLNCIIFLSEILLGKCEKSKKRNILKRKMNKYITVNDKLR